MTRLISDLLDIASIEAGHLAVARQRHPAIPLVRDAAEVHGVAAAKAAVRLDVVLPDAPFTVDCDRDRILQVLGNLIGNALKFTPAGGTVFVQAERRRQDVLFSVRDTGPGIAPGDLLHIFDRFWQKKNTAHLGTGLGLSIVKGLVETHGGRVWAESTLDQGTTFFFTIPDVAGL
jgi:signal transduction histidine kinase